MEEDFKVKAPELYEAPDYTLPQFPPENPYERKGFAFDPSEANREKFRKAIRVMRFYKERDKSEIGRMGSVMNALVAINKKYDYIDPHEAYREFFGGDIPLDQAESELESIYAATEGSEDALGEFQKLDKAQQDEIVREQSPNAKKRMPVYDSMGLPIANPVRDNPDYDPEKERADYEAKLDKKNTWEGYLRIRNAFSPEIVRDAMRFKTAFDSRSEAADAYIDRFIEKGNEYREAFISAVSLLSPELKAGFWDRVKSRVGDSYTDTYQNIIDAFIAPKSEGRRVYALAEEKGLIDENGNLSEDPEKILELQREYEIDFGLHNLVAETAGNIFARKNTDVKKLFDKGRREFERRRYYRLLRDLNRNEFSYSDGEWRTFEDALVNGEYTLRSLLLGFGVGFATKNPHAAIASTSAMMYATEAGDMYADLRFNGKVKESDAANIAATYGAMATALEQLQVSGFAGFFRKNAAIPKSWREYINLGLKEGFKEYALASADETAIEVAQSTAAFAAKKWAVANADATYEQRELWEEYLESSENAIKTMPIITGGMYGAGFPFRARAYMRKMGASVMSGIKAYFRPSKVLENNTRATGTMAEADKYFNSLIEKLGQTPEDRGWLYSYYSAKTDEERSGLLAERFSDESERDEATLILQEYENFDREATREFFKSKAEIARKLKEDDQKLLNGDTTDISVLDETDENGRYVVLESAIDALGMRDNVIFADTAEELAKVSGLSLEAAEEQMARGGAKGFYESGNGNIVVIRRHFSDGADALRTFAHEYGHRIMAKIREGDIGGYNRMCDDVLSIVGGERMAREILPASYSEAGSAQYLKDARAVAEEVLMRAAERVATKKVLDARNRGIWARFKRWFKGLFEEKSLADIADENLAQIALDVLQRERRFDVKLSGRSPKTSRNWRAKTPEINGAEVCGEWAIMDAGKLVASTDEGYDDRLQPRNRARQASKEQTNEIALNLDPARLNDSETTDLGAPIVDARGMVISGNGRTIAIRQTYGSERAERGDAYREFVYNRAKELGIDIPDGVKNPVLVRRVDNTGEMSMEEFAARSNKSQVAGMSVAEQAIADSRRILEAGLLDIFFPDAGGNVLAASNADFYNAFLNLVGGGEAYRNRDGSVRQNLSPRIRAAVLAAMLNPERRETVERLLDNPEGYNALINGLMQCAANLAELANKPEYDLSGELSQAVELFVETRDKGQTVDEFAAQTDMFREAPSAETMFLMRLFEENAKSSGGISGVLRQYAAECKKIDTTTQSLFGEENPTKLEKLEEAYRHYAADLSNEAGNGNLRWRDTGEPAAEEISEAQKQYEEVKSKYVGTPLWMKAPNGKRTNLTEEQWVRVRTPNFKRWFGDWEKEAWAKAAMDFLERTAPVANLTGQEFQKDGVKLTDKVPAYFKSIGNVARNDELGDVVLDLKGVEDSIAHGVGRLKSAAFMAVPDVIEKGFIFNREENWKERGWNTAVIVAPIKLGEDDYVCEVVVKKVRGQQRFYLHEVEIKKTLDGVFKSVANNGNASQVSKLILGKHLAEVKGNVSKVVDENGEPLVVYHGTESDFFEFKHGKAVGSGDKFGYLGEAFYATNDEDVAQTYGDRVIPIFLNLKNPYVVNDPAFTSPHSAGSFAKSLNVSTDKVSDLLKSQGYDGVIAKDEDMDYIEYAAYKSNQIKSATDNIGTYSENPDIRWREVSEPSPEEIAEANHQKADVKAKWTNPDGSMKKGYMLAPNGKHTNLTEDQWLQVRTPNFKRWFGDWETLAVINEIKDMSAKPVKLHEALDKAGIKEAFKNFGEVANERDGRKVVFPSASAGKIRRHKGFDSNTIIKHFKSLFKASIPILSEKEEIKEGHKAHGNIESVEHYVNKFSVNGSEYYIRFTVPIIRNDRSAGNVHSSAISEVSIYKNGDSTLYPLNTAGSSSPSFIDRKLSDFLNSVKPENVSKVVDENGEPVAVYHGTPKFDRFSIFKKGSGGYLGPAIYFTNLKTYAQKYENKWGDGGNLYDVFISLKRPLIVKSVNPAKEILKTIYGKDSVYDRRSQKQSYDTKILSSADIKKLQSKGYDGVIWEYGGSKEYAVYDSSKIKSATDNIGTFNTNNPDIRWREVSEPIKQKFSSGNTSLRQIAAGFKKIDFKPGSTNFDLGGGKFDEGTKYLETKGVKNFVFDPVNRDSKTNKEAFEIVKNGGFDTTTCNNVLNVISEANVRDNIILQAAKSLRPNGTAYFTVYEGDGSGKGRQSQKDSWQEHRKTVDYLGEIKKHFGDVSLKNKVITARKPILLNEKASWFMDDSFENPVRWKDDADISDISAKVKKIIDSISDKKNKHIEVLRKISDTEADFLLKKTGLDLKGYSHSIDNYSILHILKKHGSEKELQRGQIPVTIKDIQNFPTIVSDYDDVKYAGKSKIGRDTIRFEKNIGDNLVLVFEEMRIGKKLLALSTMYIQKRKKLTSNANASSNTSETLSTSSDFQESANTPENQENNSHLKALLRQERSENPDMRWKIDDPSPERVEKLRAARPVEIGENDYKGLYELNAKSAFGYVMKHLRGKKYTIFDTGEEVEIGQVGARKISTHDRYNKDYLRTFAAIPQMIENAVYLGEEPNEKGNSKYDKYRYYACGLKIGGRDYTARLTIGERNGKWYYDQALTEMEKGDLIEQVPTQASVLSARGSPNGFIDNRLISLLQENNSENSSRLRFLLRQDRRENPVIWASIVLAKQILLGRAITSARLDRVLPPERFDGTKREYAVSRAREIAERYRADKEKFGNDLNLGVQRAENDLYWTRDVVEEMYASFRRDGEEYGIARQRLMEWLKERRRRDLETVKGLSSEELGIDVPAAIEDALKKEPERRKPGENTAEESGEETFEASGEGIDAEIESAREKPAPSSIRDIIGKICAGVTKAAKARGMDEAARRRAYRNTLAEVLRESAKRLTYGREREAIMKKISDLSAKGYSVIKIKDGERAGQKIDNYTLRAEHIALRIFNRGVRDTKKELTEKFEKIVSRKGKKPSRMERDDKRALAGAVQMRVYNIKRYSEMDAAELEAEYSATVDRLENVEKNFAEDAGKGEVRSDIEDIRAEVANAVHDMKMFGNWRDKSRAQMAEGVEFLEKYIDEETEEQKARVEARKEGNARRRNVFIAALRQSKRNANKDGELRKLFRGIVNNTLPFDSILSILGEAATGKTYAEFKSLSNEIVSKVNRAAENVSNECFAKKEKLYAILRECYGEDQSTALRRLLKADAKYERFSKNPETPNPMTLANVMQLYATALQTNYQRNIFEHRIRKSEEYEKIQKRIDEIELKFPGKESKSGAEWKIASEEIETLERERDAIIANSVSDYISELEGVLTEADKNFVAALRAEYAEALPALSAVSRRVIGLPIEQADELYMPVKVDYGGGLGEGTGGVPVVPKSLSPRVSHLRDFDETADPITLYLERVKENAQFKYFSELYIELRGIFADESLQKLIRERCGADVLKLLKESIADICTGETKGFNLKAARQASGLFAIAQLGWNLGSGVRQFLPGIFSWGAYIGTPAVLRNCASFFTPEGFRAALEIAHSETGRRRFAVGNMQIIEEMLEKPDQNRFWRLYKRYALIFNRSSDMLAIMFVGQGVYRSGVESYLKKGFSEAEAKRLAMSDMWQIAERSQASGKIHNMSAWQRRGGDLAKAIGMFSSPPQLMFAKATQDMRRAIALGIKTPEGRAAAWNAVKTLFTVSVLVEGSYAASTVLWNALLKGYFDDDDDEYILKSMLTGSFGGLFLFGRLVDSLGTGYSPSAIPMEGLARPAQYTIELAKDIAVFDWDEAIKDLDKLASSAFSPWRDLRKILKDKKK